MKDVFGNELRLPRERWEHIVARHPEMKSRRQSIQETLRNPDSIVQSSNNPDVVIYHRRARRKFIAVVVHRGFRFVITAFITNKLKQGATIWHKY